MPSERCEPLRLPSVSSQGGKRWAAVLWDRLPASVQRGGTRTCLGPQSRSPNRRNNCLFLYQSTLPIFPGGAHFREGMKISDLLKGKLLSLVSLCI